MIIRVSTVVNQVEKMEKYIYQKTPSAYKRPKYALWTTKLVPRNGRRGSEI